MYDFYINQYNTTLDRIDMLYRNLDLISNRIENLNISSLNERRNYRNRRSRNNNFNYLNYPILSNRNRNNENSPYFINRNSYLNQNPNNSNPNNSNPNNSNSNNSNSNNNYLNQNQNQNQNQNNSNQNQNQNQNNFNNYLNYNPNNNNNRNLNNISSFLESIPIYPTFQEIINSTSIVRFDSINSPINDSCPISLEHFNNNDIVIRINYCGHIFKPNELDIWFQSNTRCPVCRYDIRNNNNNVNTNRTDLQSITEQILTTLLNNETDIVHDISNNILVFETYINTLSNSNSNSNSNSSL